MYNEDRETIFLGIFIATGTTGTARSGKIAFPYVIEEIVFHNTLGIVTGNRIFLGYTTSPSGVVNTDRNFRNIFSPKSVLLGDLYPSIVSYFHPQKRILEQDTYLCLELVNTTGSIAQTTATITIRRLSAQEQLAEERGV